MFCVSAELRNLAGHFSWHLSYCLRLHSRALFYGSVAVVIVSEPSIVFDAVDDLLISGVTIPVPRKHSPIREEGSAPSILFLLRTT